MATNTYTAPMVRFSASPRWPFWTASIIVSPYLVITITILDHHYCHSHRHVQSQFAVTVKLDRPCTCDGHTGLNLALAKFFRFQRLLYEVARNSQVLVGGGILEMRR